MYSKVPSEEDADVAAASAEMDTKFPGAEFTRDLWHWWRMSPTVQAFNARGVALMHAFPTGASYLRYLRNSKLTWACVYHTWEVDFGLHSTSLQKGLNASVKANLDPIKQRARLHDIVSLMRRTMAKRYLNRDLKGTPTCKSLEAHAVSVGCAAVLKVLRTHLTGGKSISSSTGVAEQHTAAQR